MVTEAETNRPYAPPSNVISVLQRIRSRNLPEGIDLEYLRDAGIPEGTVHRTFFALRFLKLIGEKGELTDALKAIATSTDEEYKAILSGLVREAYAEVFNSIDPAEDSQERILNVFRRYTPASQRNRMVVFFLGMCREAGIPTLDVPKQRSMGERKATTPRPRRTPREESKGGRGDTEVAPALDGLIRSLPPAGTALSKERRQQWLEMAEATLAFIYPENDALNTTSEREQQSGE